MGGRTPSATKKPANFNRFLSLRDRSRSASGGRSVSPAVKQRADGDLDPARGKSPRLDGNAVFIAMEAVEKKIHKGRQGMTTMKDFLSKVDNSVDAALKDFLGGMVDCLRHLGGHFFCHCGQCGHQVTR